MNGGTCVRVCSGAFLANVHRLRVPGDVTVSSRQSLGSGGGRPLEDARLDPAGLCGRPTGNANRHALTAKPAYF